MASADCSSLLINVKDLLLLQGVETQRVEFKKAWDCKKKGETYWQIIHTICAFANDFYNDNGGYIIIGVEEKEGWENGTDDRQIILPPLGVPARDLDRIQKQIMGACRENIRPEYFPILSPEVVEMKGTTKHVLVIWAMASDNRPHSCKESEKGQRRYYIRRDTETRRASLDEERQLLALHCKIPFDDRRAHAFGMSLLSVYDVSRYPAAGNCFQKTRYPAVRNFDQFSPNSSFNSSKNIRYLFRNLKRL